MGFFSEYAGVYKLHAIRIATDKVKKILSKDFRIIEN